MALIFPWTILFACDVIDQVILVPSDVSFSECLPNTFSLLDADLAVPTIARATEHCSNTLHNTGEKQLLTPLCGPPHPASHLWVTACLVFQAIPQQSWLYLNRGKRSVRKNKPGMSLFPFPWCPIKFCYAVQMLYSRIRFQEIITDWEGQHPVAVGEPVCVRVCLPKLFVCLCFRRT